MSDIIKQVAAELGLQPDDPETNLPSVDTTASGDIVITYHDRSIRWLAKSMSKQSREFNCVISVQFKPDPNRPARSLLADTRLNLMSTSGKQGVVRSLKARRDEEWAAMVEEVAAAIQDNWISGEPMIRLIDAEDIGPTVYVIDPFLQKDEHTVLFGDGGGGKSVTALATGLSFATGELVIPGFQPKEKAPVMYLDWERTRHPHRRRLAGLLAGMGITECPDLHYKRMIGQLADSADEIKHLADQEGIKLILADSVGMAVGGEISDESSVMGYFNAARYIGQTWLSVAHVPKNESNGRPIGSQYWYTQPQGGTYEMLGESEEEQNTLSVTMIHRKTNDRRNSTLAWTVTFDDKIVYKSANPLEATTDQQKIPLFVRVRAALLTQSNRTAKEIADELGTSENSVGNLLRNNPAAFHKTTLGRPFRYAVTSNLNPPVESSGTTVDSGVSTNDPPLRGEGLMETIPRPDNGKIKEKKEPWWSE